MSNTIDSETITIRKKIVSMLSTDFKIRIPENYKLSREEDTDYGFLLSFKTVNSGWKKIGETLTSKFPGLRIISINNEKICFNTQKCVLPKEDSFNSNEEDEQGSLEGENKENKTFLKTIKKSLEDRIYYGQPFPGKIIKYQGNKNIALVTFPNGEIFKAIDDFDWRKLFFLEKDDDSLLVFKDESSLGNEKIKYTNFKTKIDEAKLLNNILDTLIRNIIMYLIPTSSEPNFKCITPFGYMARYDCQCKVEYQVNDSNLAHEICKILHELAFATRKNGSIVYLETIKNRNENILENWKQFLIKNPIAQTQKGIIIGKNGRYTIDETYDYELFHFLPFNRKIDWGHVDEVGGYIDQFGFNDVVLVCETDIIDGEKKLWIVDRQHRFCHLKRTSRPVPYIKIYVHSKYELIQLVAALNSSAKKWSKNDYMNAWGTMEMDEYKIIEKWRKKEKLPVTAIITAMTGIDRRQLNKKFENGNLRFDNIEKGEKIINQVLTLQKHIPKPIKWKYGLIKFLWEVYEKENFKIETFSETLEKSPIQFSISDKEQQMIERLREKLVA